MQHLGALLLELGRTTMMLRMGQSPVGFILFNTAFQDLNNILMFRCPFQVGSVVNAGHAVYISPTGPNPIMVQVCDMTPNNRSYV